jgi:hypothetical protein
MVAVGFWRALATPDDRSVYPALKYIFALWYSRYFLK